ncbi:MAG: YceI family protein [Candidatus Limnocylindrales bacterium]|jgi:polyisoprenoid-binding protein YceI
MSIWTLDPAHSQIEFAVKHMMVTTVRGQFRKFEAEVDFDEAHPERSSVVAHIDASSIETGMEARDAHLCSADFFEAEVYPELTFRSTAIEPKGDGYRIDGELTIRGITRAVSLDAEIGGVVANLQGGRRAGFNATTKISRKAWGLTWNQVLETGGWAVGDEIKISIDLAALQAEAVAASVESAVA